MLNLNISGLASHILTLYDDWHRARKSVVEDKWQRNIEAFNCVSTGKWKDGEASGWRSDVFVPATKMKVLAAYSMTLDILLQTGELPFALTVGDDTQAILDEMGPDYEAMVDEAIEDMTHTINGQMHDCSADRQLMLMVMSGAVYGESFAKRFVHPVKKSTFRQVNLAPQGMEDDTGLYQRFEKEVTQKIQPGWEYVSPWNIVRDMESNDLQDGIGIFHRDYISPYRLRQMIGLPYYLEDEIKAAIAEAPKKESSMKQPMDDASLPPGLRDVPNKRNTIRLLEYHGRVPRRDAEDFLANMGNPSELQSAPTPDSEGDEIEVVVTLAGDRIVRFVEVEEGERPFYRIVWEHGIDAVCGTGVPDNADDMQKTLNGAIRAFIDNAKLAGDVILAVKGDPFPKWDGVIRPGSKLDTSEEVDDVRKAMQQIVIQPVGTSLIPLIELVERYLDEATLLPKILQGDLREKRKPDTAFEMNQLVENASKYLGSVIRNIDEGLIEPLVQDFYEYNMNDPAITRGKGDFAVNAWGYKSFENRVKRLQTLMQLLGLVTSNPLLVNEAKPREILDEIWRSANLDVDLGLKTRQEKEEEAQQQSPEQMAMAVELAEKEAETEKTEAETELTLAKADSERVEQQVKGWGVRFDQERQKIDKAKAVSEIETKAATLMQPPAVPNAKERGTNPYRERGMASNNQYQ